MNEFNNNPQTPPNYNPNYQNYNAPQKPKKAKKGHSTWVVIISSLLAAIIGATSGVLNESVFVAEKVSTSVSDDL